MKRLILLIFSLTLLLNQLHAIEMSVVCAGFAKKEGNFFDFDIWIVGKTLKQRQIDSINSVGEIRVVYSFISETNQKITDSLIQKSNASLDASDVRILKRIFLPEGYYNIAVTATDLNKPENKATYKTAAYLDFSEKRLRQSDILLSTKKEKNKTTNDALAFNDSLFTPLKYSVVPTTSSELIVYNEIYNTNKFIKSKLNIAYSIQKANAPEKPLANLNFIDDTASIISKNVVLNVSTLAAGSYRLVCTVSDDAGTKFSERETYFTRENYEITQLAPTLNENDIEKEFVGTLTDEQLNYDLKAIYSNLSNDEKASSLKIIKSGTSVEKKLALYKYWFNKNANLPEQAFDEYMFVIRNLEKEFGDGNTPGFDTDRGKIMLKYGKPNEIWNVTNEFNALPYEIWIYDKVALTNQINVRFLFYNALNRKNSYALLHSTSSDEVSEGAWRKKLYLKDILNDANSHKAESFFKEQ